MRTFEDYLDPELMPAAPEVLGTLFSLVLTDIPAARSLLLQLNEVAESMNGAFDGTIDETHVPGLEGDPDIRIRIYRQTNASSPQSTLIWLHGGGCVMGSVADPQIYRYTDIMTVISVEYRLAPEHRAPAAARDACAVLEYLHANADKFQIDRDGLVLGGVSGGAGVAACAALMNRDRSNVPVRGQFLLSPMVDDKIETSLSALKFPEWAWSQDHNRTAWSLYAETPNPSPYAAALRAQSFSGLPPAYLMCGGLDLFRDATIQYAQALMGADVSAELAIYPGAPHGFDVMSPMAKTSLRAIAHQRDALQQFSL